MAAYITTSDGQSYGKMRQEIVDMIRETTNADDRLARETAQIILFSLALFGSIEKARAESGEDTLILKALDIAEKYGAQMSYGR